MLAPRKDLREVTLFRVVLGAQTQKGHKRKKGISPFKLSDIMAAIETAIRANKASIGYTKAGDAYFGPLGDQHIRVTIEEVDAVKTMMERK